MAEPLLEFDTSSEIKQVENLGVTLDRLMATLRKLDNTSLDRLTRQMDEISKSESVNIRHLVSKYKEMGSTLSKLAESRASLFKKGGVSSAQFNADVLAAANALDIFKSILTNTVVSVKDANFENVRHQMQSMSKTAYEEAKKSGSYFTEITTNFRNGLRVVEAGRVRIGEAVEGILVASRNAEIALGRVTTKAAKSFDYTSREYAKSIESINSHYRQLETIGQKIWNKLGSQATPDTGLRLLADNIDKDGSRLRASLAKLEQVATLKEQIQARLGKADQGMPTSRSLSGSAASIPTVRQTKAFDYLGSDYKKDMEELSKQYKDVDAAVEKLGSSKNTKGVSDLGDAFKSLTIDGNNVHSMARGLASGFNLLWLTWGKLVPLFAGAAISNGFMQTIKLGMEVGHTFQTIAALGEVSAEGVAALRTQLSEIGKSGPYGPAQVAEAMKTLSLAGLELNEILSVTPTVLNFATAGTTSIAQAADVLVSVTTAFGTGAAGFEQSADIIVRAAADSKASVESFGEAMKTASAIGEMYSTSQNDLAVMIQLLAQVGIQGTAAGTAVRNAVADISGRTAQTERVIKSLGGSFRDATTGGVIPYVEQMRELTRITKDYDAQSQKNIVNAIYGERGGKVAAEGLKAFNEQAKDSIRYANRLEEIYASTTLSAGDSAIAAAKMAQSTQKSFEAVAATAKTVMVEVFDTIEPQMYLIADAIRKAFASDEAKSALKTLVTAVADLALVVSRNIDTVLAYGAAWLGLKAALFAFNGVMAVSKAGLDLFRASKERDTVATLAQAAAEDKLRASIGAKNAAIVTSGGMVLSKIASVLKVLPVVGNLVVLGGLAWDLYNASVSKAGKSIDDYVDTKADNIIDALQKETDHIRQVNDLRRQGLTLLEAEARLKSNNAIADIRSSGDQKIESIEKEIRDLRTENSRLTSPTDASYGLLQRQKNAEKILQLESEVLEIKDEQARSTLRMVLAEEDRKRAAEESLQLTQQEQSSSKLPRPTGTKTFSMDEFLSGQRQGNYVEGVRAAIDNSTKIIEKGMDRQLKVAESGAQRYRATLEAQYKAGELSAGEYNAKIVSLEISTQDTKTSILKSARAEANAAFDADISAAKAALAQAQKSGKSDLIKNAEARLRSLNNLQGEFNEKLQDQLNIAEDTRFQTLRKNLAEARGEFKKLLDDDDKFWKKDREEIDKAKALADVEERYRHINESIFSSARAEMEAEKARTEAMETYKAELRSLEERYADAQVAAQSFYDEQIAIKDSNESFSPEVLNYYNGLLDIAKEIQDRILLRKSDAAGNALDKANLAFDKVMRDNAASLTNALSDAVETGLLQGGKAGGAKLKDFLEAEFRKLILSPTIKAIMAPVAAGITSMFGAGSANAGQGAAMQIASGGGGSGVLGWGSNIASIFGAGGMGGSLMAGAGWLTGATTLGGSLTAGASLLGTGTLAGGAAGLGMIAGAVAPIALATAALGDIVSGLFGRKHEQRNLQGTFGGDSGFEGRWEDYYKGGWLSSSKSVYTPLEEETRSALADQFNLLKASTTAMSAVLGSGADAIEDFTFKVNIKLKDLSPEEAEKAIQAEMDKVAEALAKAQLDAMGRALMVDYRQIDRNIIGGYDESTLGQLEKDIAVWKQVLATGIRENGEVANKSVLNWVRDAIAKGEAEISRLSEEMWKPFAKAGETAAETLTRLSGSIVTVVDAFKLLDVQPLYQSEFASSLQGGKTASDYLDKFGGKDTFSQLVAGYYDAFYTEAEKTANVTESITAALATVNLTMPATREEFRALTNEYLAMGMEGADTAEVLLQVSDAFASIVPAAEEATDAISEVMKGLKSESDNLLIELYKVQGRDIEANNLQRSIDTEGMTDAEKYVYDYNQSLRDQIDALKAAQTASANAGANIQKLAERVTEAFNAMNQAGSLLDRIDAALGGSGNGYSQIREQRLWAAMSEASYEQQIELAGQLTDIVLSRYQVESQASQKQLDFARSLRDYVESLKIGSLSPLTNAQKLAEASKQYASTLDKARAGDEKAMGSLQGAASSYLELARVYFASSEDYTSIFNNVTGALDSLGVTSQSDAERQLSVSSESLGELTKLRDILEGAYASAEADYTIQKTLLQEQIDYASRTAAGVEAMVQALGNLAPEMGIRQPSGPIDIAGLAGRWTELMSPYGLTKSSSQVAAELSTASLSDLQREYAIGQSVLTTDAQRKEWDYILGQLSGGVINGSHANGLDYVPFDGYIAQLHKGERVLTERENMSYSRGSYSDDSTAELVAEVRSLRAEVSALRRENREDAQTMTRATVVSNQQNAEIIVNGVGEATSRAAYAKTLESKATLR